VGKSVPRLRRHLQRLGRACAAALAFTDMAWAAEPEAATEPPAMTQSEEITVIETLPYVPTSSSIVTKLPVALERTPANVGVVGDRLLAEQGAVTLGDALVNVSGVSVEAGQGIFDFFVLRGFDALSSGLVLTDGAPEPEVTFYPLFNVERVEVFKGPAGFLYGSNPLAGAVNLVRRQPEPGHFGRLAVEGGSFGTLAGEADWNAANDDGTVAFRLNAMHRRTDGYREGKDGELTAINPALTWRPNERASLTFNAEVGESDFQPDAGLPLLDGELPPVSRDNAYESEHDRSAQDVRRFQADYQNQLTPALGLRNKAYYRELDWSTDGTLLFGVVPNGGGGFGPFGFSVARSLLLLDDEQRLLGNQLELTYTGSALGVDHRLVAGLEVTQADDEFSLGFAPLPFTDLVDPSPESGELFVFPQGAGDSRSRVIAPYAIDHVALSERWQALAGVRFDDIDFEDDITRTSRSDGEWSPMLGLVFAPVPELSLYASAAQSFAPPSPRVVGERRPERSRQVEIGAHQAWRGGKVRTTTSIYQLERENIAIPDDNGFTQQAGDQRARGVELEMAAQPRTGLAVVASYAYTDSELTRFAEAVQVGPTDFLVLDRSGNRSAFAPEHLARAWVSQRFTGGLHFGAGLRYVGERFTAEDNLVELDDVLLFDAGAGYDVGAWGISLDLDNLTDEEYETRAFGSSSVIPAAPFAARLRVERRF
jgi:TonB-dependent siderophore receptor